MTWQVSQLRNDAESAIIVEVGGKQVGAALANFDAGTATVSEWAPGHTAEIKDAVSQYYPTLQAKVEVTR